MKSNNPRRAVSVIQLLLGAGLLAGSAEGQCTTREGLFQGNNPFKSPAAVLHWDPDGPGPLPEWLVLGGPNATIAGASAGPVVAWDGHQWRTFPGLSGTVYSLTLWDSDGPGPLPPRVVAAGLVTLDQATYAPAAAWNGHAWELLGQPWSLNQGAGFEVVAWNDPAAASPRLILMGGDTLIRLYELQAGSWVPFMPAPPNGTTSLDALTTWDPDGSGPEPEQLITSQFSIYRLDGDHWTELVGTGGVRRSAEVFCSWDRDGDGPLPAVLMAGGRLTNPNTTHVAYWDGQDWTPLPFGVNNFGESVTGLTIADTDGSGPLPPTPLAVSNPVNRNGKNVFARLVGDTWSALPGSGVLTTPKLGAWIDSIATSFDPDAEGPLPRAPIIGGDFLLPKAGTTGVLVNGAWQQLGDAPDAPVRALVGDADDGPVAGKLVLAGAFSNLGMAPASSAIFNHDGVWKPVGPGAERYLSPRTRFDFGTGSPEFVVGGAFTSIGGVNANRIARWDGNAWHPIGDGFDGEVMSLALFDLDGPGPNPPRLIAAGKFRNSGSTALASVAQWDGSSWQPVGLGITDASSAYVSSLLVSDPDAEGPLPPELYAGGRFSAQYAPGGACFAKWNGTSWQGLGTGFVLPDNLTLGSFDPDGSGPLPRQILAGGSFTNRGDSLPMKGAAVWGGTDWVPLASWFGATVTGFASFDFDGDGPRPPALIVFGSLRPTSSTSASMAILENGQWKYDFTGSFRPTSILRLDPDGPGPRREVTIYAGASSLPSTFGDAVAESQGMPTVIHDPTDTTACRFGIASLLADADGSGLSYRWQRVGEPPREVLDGPSESGAVIVGAATSKLIISSPRTADAGLYQCVVTNSCGSVTSAAARVTVCAADFDCSGTVGMDDFFDFFNAWDTTDIHADVDGDGQVDLLDFFAFFNGFDAQC